MNTEIVDILEPPEFKKTGKIKEVQQAFDDEEWVGVFNLWVIRREPELSFLFQQRSKKSGTLELGKLDVACGGYLEQGESPIQCALREAEEEIGKKYTEDQLISVGRRLSVTRDSKNRERKSVVYVYVVFDDSQLGSYSVDPVELEGLYVCSIEKFKNVYTKPEKQIELSGIDNSGKKSTIQVSRDNFFYNWDDYYLKMCVIAQRLESGEDTNLV